MKTTTINNRTIEVLDFYALKENEKMVCIENFDNRNYKVYALYINDKFEKGILISKN